MVPSSVVLAGTRAGMKCIAADAVAVRHAGFGSWGVDAEHESWVGIGRGSVGRRATLTPLATMTVADERRRS